MTTKFTAGPWMPKVEGGDLHIIANGKSIMCNMTYYPWVPENIQDWNLIAAAPELYEALELALKQISELDEMLNHHNHHVVGWHLNGNHEPVTTFFDETDHDALSVGAKALAKARGES